VQNRTALLLFACGYRHDKIALYLKITPVGIELYLLCARRVAQALLEAEQR
jgi:hypothetical protein